MPDAYARRIPQPPCGHAGCDRFSTFGVFTPRRGDLDRFLGNYCRLHAGQLVHDLNTKEE